MSQKGYVENATTRLRGENGIRKIRIMQMSTKRSTEKKTARKSTRHREKAAQKIPRSTKNILGNTVPKNVPNQTMKQVDLKTAQELARLWCYHCNEKRPNDIYCEVCGGSLTRKLWKKSVTQEIDPKEEAIRHHQLDHPIQL